MFVMSDEPLDVRRLNTLQRLKSRAEREGRSVIVSRDCVLSVDGVDTFSLQNEFIALQESTNNRRGGQQ